MSTQTRRVLRTPLLGEKAVPTVYDTLTGDDKVKSAESGPPHQVWNLVCLAAAYSINFCAIAGHHTATTLIAGIMFGKPALSTIPNAISNLGAIVFAVPIARATHHRAVGRKRGLISGNVLGVLGSIVVVISINYHSFPLLLVGSFFLGGMQCCNQYIRFAASESVTERLRSRAIPRVFVATSCVGSFGPQLVQLFDGQDAIGLPMRPFAGFYVTVCMLAVANMIVIAITRLPKKHHASEESTEQPADPYVSEAGTSEQTAALSAAPRSLLQLLCTPEISICMLSAFTAFFVMTLVMNSTPLGMQLEYSYKLGAATTTLQIHFISMFIPGIITGNLIETLGMVNTILLGQFCFAICFCVALTGSSFVHFAVTLAMLGVGWNFSFMSATRLLVASYVPSEAGKVEGVNEMVLQAGGATASCFAGIILDSWGWDGVILTACPLIAITTMALVVLKMKRRRKPVSSLLSTQTPP